MFPQIPLFFFFFLNLLVYLAHPTFSLSNNPTIRLLMVLSICLDLLIYNNNSEPMSKRYEIKSFLFLTP
jgi:hypothetical protein